jgi:hypothetical protein
MEVEPDYILLESLGVSPREKSFLDGLILRYGKDTLWQKVPTQYRKDPNLVFFWLSLHNELSFSEWAKDVKLMVINNRYETELKSLVTLCNQVQGMGAPAKSRFLDSLTIKTDNFKRTKLDSLTIATYPLLQDIFDELRPWLNAKLLEIEKAKNNTRSEKLTQPKQYITKFIQGTRPLFEYVRKHKYQKDKASTRSYRFIQDFLSSMDFDWSITTAPQQYLEKVYERIHK